MPGPEHPLARLPSYLFTIFRDTNNLGIPVGCKIKIKHKNQAAVGLDHMLHPPHTQRTRVRRDNRSLFHLHIKAHIRHRRKMVLFRYPLMYIWCLVNCFLLPVIFLSLSQCTNWPHSSKLLSSKWLWGQQHLFNPSLINISVVSGFCQSRGHSHEHPVNSRLCLQGLLLCSRQRARYVLNFNMHQQTVP